MEEYTIYCTEEQTRKALELGAPINRTHANPPSQFTDKYPHIIWVSTDDNYIDVGYCIALPTAEQMICWLEEKGYYIEVIMGSKRRSYLWQIDDRGARPITGRSDNDYSTRKEATLSAIDAAIEYLSRIN